MDIIYIYLPPCYENEWEIEPKRYQNNTTSLFPFSTKLNDSFPLRMMQKNAREALKCPFFMEGSSDVCESAPSAFLLNKLSLRQLNSRDESEELKIRCSVKDSFGPLGPGILLVNDLPPSYFDLRKQLLDAGNALPYLSQDELASLELPSIHHAVGWSHGREQFNGAPDLSKGSFYANPLYDDPSLGQPHLVKQYP